jgi:5-methylcytosine-specific restriction endonuclease McrA
MLTGKKRIAFIESKDCTCYVCLRQRPIKDLQIDHILPKYVFPEVRSEIINYAVICKSCNNYKHSLYGVGLQQTIDTHQERVLQLKRVQMKQESVEIKLKHLLLKTLTHKRIC